MGARPRFSAAVLFLSACLLAGWSGLAAAQKPSEVTCKSTETQSECHARLQCKAYEELTDCQKRLLKCKAGETVPRTMSRVTDERRIA